MDYDLVLKKLKSSKLLKKNKKFNWMSSYYFSASGDVYFGNLFYMIRLVGIHDLGESRTVSIDGEEADEDNTKIIELFQKAHATLKGNKPMLSVLSYADHDANKFDMFGKIVDDENVLCYLNDEEKSINYLSADEKFRMKAELDWDTGGLLKGEFYTFLNPKTISGLLRLMDEDDQKIKYVFFDDPLPTLIISKYVQIICFSGKEVPYYFEEYYPKKRNKK